MHKELFRNLNILVWKSIDSETLSHYLGHLKSRIYKASIERSYKKIHALQSILINSPAIRLFAFKKIFCQYENTIVLNSFQLGYLIFYFNFDTYIVTTTYSLEMIDILFNKSKEISLILCKIKNLLIQWSIEPYFNYLCDLNNISFLQYYSCNNININNVFYAYCFTLDLKSLFYYLDLNTFINRLKLLNLIQEFLYEFLNLGKFIILIKSLSCLINLSSLKKKDKILFNKLIDIFILTLCYETNILLKSYKFTNFSVTIVIHHGTNLLIYCENFLQLQCWRQTFLDILIANGLNLRYVKSFKKIFSLRHINSNWMFTNFFSSKLNLISSLSLKSQYFLFKQILILFKQSVSKSSFLLVIRLNKILLFWSNLYNNNQKKSKVLAFLDYIVYLKLKSFIRQVYSAWSIYKVRKIYFPVKKYCFDSIVYNTGWVFIVNVNYYNYYRSYFTIKLFWLV